MPFMFSNRVPLWCIGLELFLFTLLTFPAVPHFANYGMTLAYRRCNRYPIVYAPDTSVFVLFFVFACPSPGITYSIIFLLLIRHSLCVTLTIEVI